GVLMSGFWAPVLTERPTAARAKIASKPATTSPFLILSHRIEPMHDQVRGFLRNPALQADGHLVSGGPLECGGKVDRSAWQNQPATKSEDHERGHPCRPIPWRGGQRVFQEKNLLFSHGRFESDMPRVAVGSLRGMSGLQNIAMIVNRRARGSLPSISTKPATRTCTL